MRSNKDRAQQLEDIRARLGGIYEECDDLLLEMGENNKMGRLWSRKVKDPICDVMDFIRLLQRRAKELGKI